MPDIWSSDLAARHLGGPKLDTAIVHTGPDTHCAFCGKPIRTGDLCEPATKLGEFFSDTRDLAAYTGLSCPSCARVRGIKEMFALQRSVVTEDAVYSIASTAVRAWLFTTPPRPPFVAMLTTATLQHLVWRTPVTLSRDILYVRHGARLHTIRPEWVAHARDACLRWRETDKMIKWGPFVYLDRKEQSPGHGMLRDQVWQRMSAEAKDLFLGLTPGEIWALAHVIDVAPVTPEPINVKGENA